MKTPRRIYIYLVSAISLQSITWAMIALFRNLFISGLRPNLMGLSFQIAVIVVGLPMYLGHWLWAQRLATKEIEEREDLARRVYLYGMQAALLIPFIASAFTLLRNLPSVDTILFEFIGMCVLGFLWYFHQRIQLDDANTVLLTGRAAVVRRVYVLGFTAAGLGMTITAIIHLLRWILFQLGGGQVIGQLGGLDLMPELARLVVGVPLWLLFWGWEQRLFAQQDTGGLDASLRNFYLIALFFVAILSSVTNGTFILAGGLRRLLVVSTSGASNGDIRIPITTILGMLALWGYHAYILRRDTRLHDELPGKEAAQRICYYLIAGIGFASLIGGVSGNISVLIRALGQPAIGNDLKGQVAWFTAATIAGLMVWVLPWREAQSHATTSGSIGDEERRSQVRKAYLYFFLFIATITILSSVVFIVYGFIRSLLGEPPLTLTELGHPIAFSMIALCIWQYHRTILRGDTKRLLEEQVVSVEGFRVVVLDVGDDDFGKMTVEKLTRDLPGMDVQVLVLNPVSGDPARTEGMRTIAEQLSESSLIIAPWIVTVPGAADGAITEEISQAVVNSQARKLLLPIQITGWEWVGVDRIHPEAMVKQIAQAVDSMLRGEEFKHTRSVSGCWIAGIVIGALLLLALLGPRFFGFMLF